jgi:toxin YhaV
VAAADRRHKGDRRRHDRRAFIEPEVTVAEAHGWTLLAHPLLVDQLDRLTKAAELENQEAVGSEGLNTKLLGHLLDLMFEKIPQRPGDPMFRHGGAVGGGNREWFRAKTGNGRYRLFYRYDTRHKVIVYAWVNDEQTLRTYGSSTDAYAVFAKMLEAGNPPRDWSALVQAASEPGARAALARLETARTVKTHPEPLRRKDSGRKRR